MYRRCWRERDVTCVDQVANGPDRLANLTPASDAPAAAVHAAWAPLLSGQPIPLLGERRWDDTCDLDCD